MENVYYYNFVILEKMFLVRDARKQIICKYVILMLKHIIYMSARNKISKLYIGNMVIFICFCLFLHLINTY